MRSSKSRGRFLTLCVAPAVILYFVFMILPTLNVHRNHHPELRLPG